MSIYIKQIGWYISLMKNILLKIYLVFKFIAYIYLLLLSIIIFDFFVEFGSDESCRFLCSLSEKFQSPSTIIVLLVLLLVLISLIYMAINAISAVYKLINKTSLSIFNKISIFVLAVIEIYFLWSYYTNAYLLSFR